MEDKLIEIVGYVLPAVVLGIVVYYFFNRLIKQLNNQFKIATISQKKKEGLPIKLLAYERMVLFCERINPIKLLIRVKPIETSSQGYLQLLLKSIEQEFEHNLVQQLYISDECWNVIITSKAATIQKLKQIATISENAQELREKMMLAYKDEIPATETAIAFIKSETKKLIS